VKKTVFSSIKVRSAKEIGLCEFSHADAISGSRGDESKEMDGCLLGCCTV
jgi:hypothetical protein